MWFYPVEEFRENKTLEEKEMSKDGIFDINNSDTEIIQYHKILKRNRFSDIQIVCVVGRDWKGGNIWTPTDRSELCLGIYEARSEISSEIFVERQDKAYAASVDIKHRCWWHTTASIGAFRRLQRLES